MKRKSLLIVVLLMIGALSATVVANAQDTVTLKFWHAYNETGPENQLLTDTLIPMFEQSHPNIKVESDPYPYDDLHQTLLTSAAGGEGPDIVRADIIWSPEFADQGILLDLSKAMPDFQDFAKNTFA